MHIWEGKWIKENINPLLPEFPFHRLYRLIGKALKGNFSIGPSYFKIETLAIRT